MSVIQGARKELATYQQSMQGGTPYQQKSFWDVLPQNEAIRQTNNFNARMSDYGYAKDLESWHRNNAYNDPSMQMERFKSAGLNPNLMYGQGNAGNASQQSSYQRPKAQPRSQWINPISLLMTLLQLKSLKASVLSKELDNEKKGIDLGKGGIFEGYGGLGNNPMWDVNPYKAKVYNQMLGSRQKIILGKSNISTAQFNVKVAKLAATLAEQGIRPSDSLLARTVILAMEKTGYNLSDITAQVLKLFLP